MTSKTFTFALVALAAVALAPVFGARADTPAVPENAEQCMTMVETVIAAQSKVPSDPKKDEAFDGIVGQAMQNCDKKDFAAAQKLAVEAMALLSN